MSSISNTKNWWDLKGGVTPLYLASELDLLEGHPSLELKVSNKSSKCTQVMIMISPEDSKITVKVGLVEVFGHEYWVKICLAGSKGSAGGGVTASVCPFCFKHGTNESTVMTHIRCVHFQVGLGCMVCNKPKYVMPSDYIMHRHIRRKHHLHHLLMSTSDIRYHV